MRQDEKENGSANKKIEIWVKYQFMKSVPPTSCVFSTHVYQVCTLFSPDDRMHAPSLSVAVRKYRSRGTRVRLMAVCVCVCVRERESTVLRLTPDSALPED